MGGSASAPEAENDRQLMNAVERNIPNPYHSECGRHNVIGNMYYGALFSYYWKPCSGPYNLEIIPYPENAEFRRRIPYAAWLQFNADLAIDQYNRALPGWILVLLTPVLILSALLPCISCIFAFLLNGGFIRRRFLGAQTIVEHYTKHLFHPMLIDVQFFHKRIWIAGGGGTDGGGGGYIYFNTIGFFIANDPAEFHSIPAPQPGISSGYKDGWKGTYSRDTVPATFPQSTPVPPPYFPEAPELAMKGPQRAVYGHDFHCFGTRTNPQGTRDAASLIGGPVVAVPLDLPPPGAPQPVPQFIPFLPRAPATAQHMAHQRYPMGAAPAQSYAPQQAQYATPAVQMAPVPAPTQQYMPQQSPYTAPAVQMVPVSAARPVGAPAQGVAVSYALPGPQQAAGFAYQPGQVVATAYSEV